ncbi:hypothetical protein AgCh_032248 [Apium graveolens]
MMMEKLKNLMAVFVTFLIMSLMISLPALACPADGSEFKDCITNRMKLDCPACAPIMRCMAQCLWDNDMSQKQCVEKCHCDVQTDKFTIRSDLNIFLNKYESIKITILKKVEYPTWKVKMLMHLEATDPDYLDIINDGPYMPIKLVPATRTVAEHYQLKEKSEWTPEEKVVLKDAKVRNILHNSLDYVMSNRVIAYKTAKEI